MGIDWQSRKRDVDRYTPEIKAYLAAAFIIESPARIDENEATEAHHLGRRPPGDQSIYWQMELAPVFIQSAIKLVAAI